MSRFTPEEIAIIAARQRNGRLTWFGRIVYSLGIPMQFFPGRWVVEITPLTTEQLQNLNRESEEE